VLVLVLVLGVERQRKDTVGEMREACRDPCGSEGKRTELRTPAWARHRV
jgi:hypothetical protein